jgi:hypothetical protein
MANKTTTKKKEPMIILGLRVPRSLFERLEKRAIKESARSGTGNANVSAVARALLHEHA